MCAKNVFCASTVIVRVAFKQLIYFGSSNFKVNSHTDAGSRYGFKQLSCRNRWLWRLPSVGSYQRIAIVIRIILVILQIKLNGRDIYLFVDRKPSELSIDCLSGSGRIFIKERRDIYFRLRVKCAQRWVKRPVSSRDKLNKAMRISIRSYKGA